jgi:hypothetical protein
MAAGPVAVALASTGNILTRKAVQWIFLVREMSSLTYLVNDLMRMGQTDDLMTTHMEQHRWRDAEELGLRIVESYYMVLGGYYHPRILAAMVNLATMYKDQG